MQAETFPPWALDELTARVKKGDLAWAREAADTLAPFWDRAAAQVKEKGFLTEGPAHGSPPRRAGPGGDAGAAVSA